MPQHVKLKDVEIWFQDEARIGQQGSLTRVWHYRGERPKLVRQQQFNSAYIFGAVCPSNGNYSRLIIPCVNKNTMELHMKAISEQVSKGKHALVIMDGALWHQASLNQDNVTLFKIAALFTRAEPHG